MNRPSHKELNKKLNEARALSEKQQVSIVEPLCFAADAIGLGYDIEDIFITVSGLLNEILPDHYAGGRPPQRSYEDCITGSDLFAFEWHSEILAARVYCKFAIRGTTLWIVSLHKSRKK
ncbi:MAG: hypothetical protein FJ119_04145 [Deltaproteobacteria bacterium]|nr:hypothetical protein [Deltaproteobacteria bacterium]